MPNGGIGSVTVSVFSRALVATAFSVRAAAMVKIAVLIGGRIDFVFARITVC